MEESQKSVNMKKHQQKFDLERIRQQEIANEASLDEDDLKNKIKKQTRQAQLDKLIRNAGFMEEWL